MSVFTRSQLHISPALDNDWRVAKDIHWEMYDEGSEVWLTVPKGFVTDLASVPRPLWWLLAPHGQPQVLAAVLHDYLYRTPEARPFGTHTKRGADKVFRDAMKALKVPFARRWVMWAAVRCAPWAGVDWS